MSKRRKRHGPHRVLDKLREADALLNAGQNVGQVIQHLGASQQTCHRWRQQFGGMKAEEARRPKELEQENPRFRKLVADLSLDRAFLKEAIDHLGNG